VASLEFNWRSTTKEMAASVYNLLTLDAFTPRCMMKLSFDGMQTSAEAIRLITPWRETRLVWREFQNKLEAFSLFAFVDSALQIPRQREVRLRDLVKKTDALEPYRALWTTEGLGYYVGMEFWEQGKGPQDLLADQSKELPERSLVALHTGMGMAIASRLIETVRSGSDEFEIRRALEQFVTACRDNSKTGYTGAAYESLGLVTRTLYPQMVMKLDQQLRKLDQDLSGYFWHGVGRGIYFAPVNFLPDGNSLEHAMRMAGEQPPHELGRRNALAGLAWAMMLVNLRHPEIIENFLKRQGDQLADREAFVNGVISSLMIWRDSTGDDTCLKAILDYQSESSDKTAAERWERMVRHPCLEALEYVYPVLKEHQRLDEVFQYRDLSELTQ